MEECDVLVVGAGLSGLQTAQLLAAAGQQVVLVDRKISVEEKVHTTGIFVRRTLEDFDLPEDCLGPVIRHVHIYSPAGRRMTLVSSGEEFRIGTMARLYSQLLESGRQQGVAWRNGTSYVASAPNGKRSIVQLDCKGHREQLATRFIIGADGAVSRVGNDLGLSENKEWILGLEDVWEGIPLQGPPCVHCYVDPQIAPGYIAWVAHDGNDTHVGVGGYAERYQPVQALDELMRRVRDQFDFDRGTMVERRGGRIPVGGILKRIASPRGLLMGDAAGAVSPLTAGGLDPCLRLAALGAQVTTNYLTTGDIAALDPYAGNRFRKKFFRRVLMRRAISAFRYRWMYELGLLAASCWPVKGMVQSIFFGRGSFPIESAELHQE